MSGSLHKPLPEWVGKLKIHADRLRSRGLYRTHKALASPQGTEVVVEGRRVLNFCSNDYLGLANEAKLVRAVQTYAEEFGIGSGASPLVCGRSHAHAELESRLAQITGRDRAIIFSSGYLANLAIATALCSGRNDLIIGDRFNHASMIQGALLSRARFKRYQHRDPASLRRQLANEADCKLVFTDGVFSMDGDIAPLPALSDECRAHAAVLVVDDAHGFGVLGRDGRGTLEHFGLGQDDVPVMMATFGKALGVSGAFVAGAEDLIEMLVQSGKPYIYSTALPAFVVKTVSKSLELLEEERWRRERLLGLVRRFKEGAAARGLTLLESSTPIQPLLVGDAHRAVALSEALLRQDILVVPIRPPTVPVNSARLRITMTAIHTDEQVDRLLEALETCLDLLNRESQHAQ